MNINEFPQQVNQVISIARNHITRSNIGDIFIWFSNNEWAASR